MTTINSPLELWRRLCAKEGAGLELRLKSGRPGRDADIEDTLKSALTVPATWTLDDWLQADSRASRPTVTTERLLIEIMKSQAGFARMMEDILALLIEADAKEGAHQLSVAFKFDDVSDPIMATLEAFRQTVERTRRMLERRPKLPDNNVMWRLEGLLSPSRPAIPRDLPLDSPDSTLNPTGHTEIDAQLAGLVQLVSGFRRLWRKHGTTRQEIRDAASALRSASTEQRILQGQLFAGHDNWDVSVLYRAQALVSQVRSGALLPQEACNTLNEALGGIEWGTHWVEETFQELLDILNLPAWRRRHELYAVWVGAQLLKVIGQVVPDMRFHPVDGVLSFEFGGSRLATYNWNKKQFDVWAELRSPLVGTSAKRKKGIQPDFRVLQPALSGSTNAQTAYVLECKHYLEASITNFTQAAADYARSCPNAKVHVVNHGPADDAVLNAALPPPPADSQPLYRQRHTGAGNRHPGSEPRHPGHAVPRRACADCRYGFPASDGSGSSCDAPGLCRLCLSRVGSQLAGHGSRVTGDRSGRKPDYGRFRQ